MPKPRTFFILRRNLSSLAVGGQVNALLQHTVLRAQFLKGEEERAPLVVIYPLGIRVVMRVIDKVVIRHPIFLHPHRLLLEEILPCLRSPRSVVHEGAYGLYLNKELQFSLLVDQEVNVQP